VSDHPFLLVQTLIISLDFISHDAEQPSLNGARSAQASHLHPDLDDNDIQPAQEVPDDDEDNGDEDEDEEDPPNYEDDEDGEDNEDDASEHFIENQLDEDDSEDEDEPISDHETATKEATDSNRVEEGLVQAEGDA